MCEVVVLVRCFEVCKTSEIPLEKVLIVAVRKCHCGGLIRGLQNLDSPCKGERVVTFCIVQKVTKKHARTCKKLPVASFCASETAETGRIANGREQGDHVSRRRLRPAAHDSKLCRKRLRKNFRRHISKPVLSAKRRRRGFESVRKGYCSAAARPLFFEKEKVYCKLTVRFHRQNLWLHVSLGAVRNCCRGAPRNSISLSVSFA